MIAQRGFTLIELLIALTLMALMSAILFGSLRMAGKSWDTGGGPIGLNLSATRAQNLSVTNPEAVKL